MQRERREREQRLQDEVKERRMRAEDAIADADDLERQMNQKKRETIKEEGRWHIVKVLLSEIYPTAKLSDYTTMKVCTKWSGELAGGTTLTVEMTAIVDNG